MFDDLARSVTVWLTLGAYRGDEQSVVLLQDRVDQVLTCVTVEHFVRVCQLERRRLPPETVSLA